MSIGSDGQKCGRHSAIETGAKPISGILSREDGWLSLRSGFRPSTNRSTWSRRDALGIAAVAAGLTGAAGARAARPGYGIVGQTAPPIEAQFWIGPDGSATTFDMLQTKGRWVLLKCFQSWCPGCHSHGLPALQAVTRRYANHDQVQLLAVQTVFEGFGTNTADKVRETQLRYELPIVMGHDAGDPEGDHRPATMRRYRTGGTPWMIVIDPRGMVVYNEFSLNAERFIEFLDQQLVS